MSERDGDSARGGCVLHQTVTHTDAVGYACVKAINATEYTSRSTSSGPVFGAKFRGCAESALTMRILKLVGNSST